MELHHGAEARCLALLFVHGAADCVFVVVSDAVSVHARPLV